MDKQEQIKHVIDETQPSYERKLALLFLLAMPKTTEKRIVQTVKETLAKNNVTDREMLRLGVVLGLLTASIREAARQASEGEPSENLEDYDFSQLFLRPRREH